MEKKSAIIVIRATPRQKHRLQKIARARGLGLSSWLLATALACGAAGQDKATSG